jgi:hypothetical protein
MTGKRIGAGLLALMMSMALMSMMIGCSPKEETANVTSGGSSGTVAQKPPVETPPSASAEPGDPIAGAKALVEKANKTEKFSDMSELFTNESAAAFALPVSMVLGLFAGMGDAFASMGDSLSKMGGEKTQQSEKSKKDMESLKKMSADLKAFNKKYAIDSLSLGAKPDDAKIKALVKNGRPMLKELGLILESSGQDVGDMKPTNKFSKAEEIEYQVISPTEVKLTSKKAGKLPKNATAKFEDGAWRLSLGTFDEIMKEMKTQNSGGMGAPMGGGMGMPGGSGTTP